MNTQQLDAPPALLLTVDQVAERTQFSKRYVEKLIERGEIPVVRIGETVRITPADLDNLVSLHRTRGKAKDVLPNREERNQIADALLDAARCLRDGDEHGMARAINTSRFPLKFFVYEAISLLAFADDKSDRTLLDTLQKIAGTPD